MPGKTLYSKGALPLMFLEATVVKMKLGKLRGNAFLTALQRAMAFEKVPVEASFKMRKIAKKIYAELEVLEEEHQKLLKKCCELDGGKPKTVSVTDTVSQYVYKKGGKSLHEEEFKKLAALEVELPLLSPEDLGESLSQFKPEDFFQLEFIDYPEVK